MLSKTSDAVSAGSSLWHRKIVTLLVGIDSYTEHGLPFVLKLQLWV